MERINRDIEDIGTTHLQFIIETHCGWLVCPGIEKQSLSYKQSRWKSRWRHFYQIRFETITSEQNK